jgi:hypothetical protein
MKDHINYEKEVKDNYPTAMRVGVSVDDGSPLMHMIIGCRLGENYSPTAAKAWKRAYDKLIKSKIS